MILCLAIGTRTEVHRIDGHQFELQIEQDGCIQGFKKNQQWYLNGNDKIKGIDSSVALRFKQSLTLEYTGFYCPFELTFFEETAALKRYRRIVLTKDSIFIGSGKQDIQLKDMLSGMKLELIKKQGGWQITDYSKVPLLEINQCRQVSALLQPQDHLRYLHWQAWLTEDFLMMNLVQRTKLPLFVLPIAPAVIKPKEKLIITPQFRWMEKIEPMLWEEAGFPVLESRASGEPLHVPQMLMALSAISVGALTFLRGLLQLRSWLELLPTMIFPITMGFTAILYPWLLQRKQSKAFQQLLNQRKMTYDKVLLQLDTKIQIVHERLQKAILKRYPEQLDFQRMDSSLYFQRLPHHADALQLLLGKGQRESLIQLRFKNNPTVTIWDQPLLKAQQDIQQKAAWLQDCVIELDLKKYNKVGFVVNEKEAEIIFTNVAGQLVLLHDPQYFRCVMIIKPEQDHLISLFAGLPHFRTRGGTHRLMMTGEAQVEALQDEMMELLQQGTLVLFVLDKVGLNAFRAELLAHKNTVLIHFCQAYTKLLSSIELIVDVTCGGMIHDLKNQKNTHFSSVLTSCGCFEQLKLLQRKKLQFSAYRSLALPSGILACFQSRLLHELNIEKRWKANAQSHQLKAILGFDEQCQQIELDLHEKYDGPHGLIAGSTGSGKSECLLTMILSLAINYSPRQLQFVILDYKGGSSILPLSNPQMHLPHLTGTITNQDGFEITRSLRLLKQECQLRQRLFLQASQLHYQAITDLDHYRKVQKSCPELKELAHLILIVDEFAELKKEQPLFMQELISIARIGRSLGIHLVLATQKPSGIVDEQILGNINFRICLKVQTEQDSREMIQSNKAARITEAGWFYLVTAKKEQYGRAAYCHAYYPEPPFCFEVLDSTLHSLYQIKESSENTERQIQRIVPLLQKKANELNQQVPMLWQSCPKTGPDVVLTAGRSIFGWLDDLESRQFLPFVHDYCQDGNCLVYGGSFQTRIKVLQQGMMSLLRASSEQVVYLVYSKKSYWQQFLPLVSDAVGFHQSVRLKQWLTQMNQLLEQRIVTNVSFPPVFIVIENLISLVDSLTEIKELIELLREGAKENLFILCGLSNLSGFRLQLLDYFNCRIALEPLTKVQQLNYFNQCLEWNSQKPIVNQKGLKEFICTFDSAEKSIPAALQCQNWKIWTMPDKLSMEHFVYMGIPLGVEINTGKLVEATGKRMLLITGMYEVSTIPMKQHLEHFKHQEIPLIDDLDGFLDSFDKNLQKAAQWLYDNKAVLFCPYFKWNTHPLKGILHFESILWVGNGFSSQSLLFSSVAELLNLDDLEGVISIHGRQKKIRCFSA